MTRSGLRPLGLLVLALAGIALLSGCGAEHAAGPSLLEDAASAEADDAARGGLPALGGASGDDPFAQLPLVVPGTLAGRIRYLSSEGCELREYDLQTGTDTAVAPSSVLCEAGFPVFSPIGAAFAVRGLDGRVTVKRTDRKPLVLGKRVPPGTPPGNSSIAPSFSPNGRRIAYCTYSRTRLWTAVANSATGDPVATITGSCEAVFTARGVAVLRGDRLILRGRTIYQLQGETPANIVTDFGPQGNPLATNPQGTLLALATRPLGEPANVVTIHLLRLDGHELASYRAPIDIPVSFQALAPSGRSAVIWWGDILQLAAFGTPPGSLTLRYNLAPHVGDGDHEISPVAYSPNNGYAIMPRRVYPSRDEPAPAPQPALILTANTLEPQYRLPINAQAAVWLKPATNPSPH